MNKIELEVLTTAFQIEMEKSWWVIVWSESEDQDHKAVFWWNHEKKQLQDSLNDFDAAEIVGKMIGWAKIPFIDGGLD